MSPETRSRKAKRVNQNVKSETSAARAVAGGPASRARSPGTRKEDWIANQLRHVYDDALHEDIPNEMLDLLRALDDPDPNPDEEDRG